MTSANKRFWAKVAKLPRKEILQLIKEQDPDLLEGIRRIEWVFANRMNHLTWPHNGEPITERPLTNEELALLVDPPFVPDRDLTKMGLSNEQQRSVHIASDRVLWAKHVLNVKPRVYQTLVLRHPNLRKVMRWGRRLGKTWTMAVILLHYAYTTKYGHCLVMAPMKSHVKLIYDEVMKLAVNAPAVGEAIRRNVTSPQYEIELTNGSAIRFFTTGMKSGGKSDVARGQEAHIIILDEMDYMGGEDLVALYAMLQRTDENQPDKMLIAASTPTGRREKFWEWCVRSKRFQEFWFPSYCNPNWTAEDEEEMREEYSEMAYRHEIEADFGEDAEGVYPRKYVDRAFLEPGWKYLDRRTSARSFHLLGVDWDKFGAGPNIVVLEVCDNAYEEERFAGRMRVAFREEIPRNEFVLTETVDRIIELNRIFNPRWIYVDRGFGDTQVELLHKFGLEHPETGLRKKVKGISFSGSQEVRDPATKQWTKMPMKPFMVENLRTMLEQNQIAFPRDDEELYMQLISYIVVRTTEAGKPVFEASGSQQDHAHDALILACLAYTDNYGEFNNIEFARISRSISNRLFLPQEENPDVPPTYVGVKVENEKDSGPRRRALVPRRRAGANRPIVRRKF